MFSKWSRTLSGSAKRKQKKEKEAKDAALVQQIPFIATFFTRKLGHGEGTHNSGASASTQQDDLQDANTASSGSPKTLDGGGAVLHPMDLVADNASCTTA